MTQFIVRCKPGELPEGHRFPAQRADRIASRDVPQSPSPGLVGTAINNTAWLAGVWSWSQWVASNPHTPIWGDGSEYLDPISEFLLFLIGGAIVVVFGMWWAIGLVKEILDDPSDLETRLASAFLAIFAVGYIGLGWICLWIVMTGGLAPRM